MPFTRRVFLRLSAALFALSCAAPSQAAAPDAQALAGGPLLAALKTGGLVLYFRHTSTDFGQNDEQMTGYEDCARQRNLTDAGRAEARAIGGGVWLRLDQIASQLLLEDEWHAVYRVVHDTPAAVFLDFGHSDSSIPLTLLYLFESRTLGLSELGMRAPLLAAGIATLMLF